MYFKTPLLEVDSQSSTSSRKFKVAIALIGGSCLVLVGFMAMSTFSPTFHSDSSTSLIGMPTSLRKPSSMLPMTMPNLPGASPWKEMTIAAIQANNRCDRDVSMNAILDKAKPASMSSADRAVVAKAADAVSVSAADLLKAGQTPPLGFWDPAGLSTDVSEGRLLFFREAEIKHGRVCMLAFVGILVGEQYHPLFGGNVDTMAAHHFTGVVPDVFWGASWVQFMFASFWEEKRTSFPTLEWGAFSPVLAPKDSTEPFAAKTGRIPGDFGFDPLGLKPKNEKDLIEMQNKELNNGRLAMFAVLGVIGQELATNKAVFR